MLIHHGAVPELRSSLGHSCGVIVQDQIVPFSAAGYGLTHGGQMHHIEHILGKIAAAVRFLGSQLGDGYSRGQFNSFVHGSGFLSIFFFLYMGHIRAMRHGLLPLHRHPAANRQNHTE
jgi:hypothetical protein